MKQIKAIARQPSGFRDVEDREEHVTIVGFVETKTPDTSRMHGNHSGLHAVCVTSGGRLEAYPIHQLRVEMD